MKNFIYRFLILCAGSDNRILSDERCPRSEHIKHAGFGTLVLIPAILGFYSMTYAISTFVENRALNIIAGVTWSGILFAFDRFVVSTFRKRESIYQDAKSFAFISRLIFSVFVGIAVAHPLVLLYFDNSISVNMDDFARAKKDSIEAVYKIQKDVFQNRIDTIDNNLKEPENEITEWEKKIHDEVVSRVRDDARGISGVPGIGLTYRDDTSTLIRKRRLLNQKIIANEKKKFKDSLEIVKRDSTKAKKIKDLTFSRDYLEREKALRRLSSSNTIISVTTWFLILFFVFIDILPATWKALSKKGPYDDILNSIELAVSNEVEEVKIESETKLAIYKRNRERDRVVHTDNKRAEEVANREFSEGQKKEMLKKVFETKQTYESNGEILSEKIDGQTDLRSKILREEIEFRRFCFKMIAEIELWTEEDLKTQAYQHLDELKRNFNDNIESIFEEYSKISNRV